jgi:hypothetical protein
MVRFFLGVLACSVFPIISFMACYALEDSLVQSITSGFWFGSNDFRYGQLRTGMRD